MGNTTKYEGSSENAQDGNMKKISALVPPLILSRLDRNRKGADGVGGIGLNLCWSKMIGQNSFGASRIGENSSQRWILYSRLAKCSVGVNKMGWTSLGNRRDGSNLAYFGLYSLTLG